MSAAVWAVAKDTIDGIAKRATVTHNVRFERLLTVAVESDWTRGLKLETHTHSQEGVAGRLVLELHRLQIFLESSS